ncbi:MAG TPA: HD domain-containing phosphohydrolase [Acidobacteriota bacterium]
MLLSFEFANGGFQHKLMFRNSQLVRDPDDKSRANPAAGDRPVAVLADDNEAEVSILRPVLEKYNFQVVLAADGEHALSLALKLSARLVIATLRLPRIDGYQLCQKLREQRSTETIPFMFITSQGEIPDKLMGHQTFASDYVQRPINLNEFENRLVGVLRVQAAQPSSGPAFAPEIDSVVADLGKKQHSPPTAPADRQTKIASEEVEELMAEFERWKKPAAVSGTRPEGGESLNNILDKFHKKTAADKIKEKSRVAGKQPVAETTKQEAAQETPRPQANQTAPAVESKDAKIVPVAPADVPAPEDRKEVGEDAELIYREANVFLVSSIRRVEDNEKLDVGKGVEIAQRIADSLKRGNGLLLFATERTTEFTLGQHCSNVAIIAARIAQTLRMPEERIVRIALAGLVHDIGSAKLPQKLLYRTGQFGASERAEIERRPIYSAQILSDIPGFDWLPQLVIQVHERENGKGYPYHLEGKEITEEAKVLGIADVFEARIHPRPHRNPMTGYELLESLTSEGGGFADRIIKSLIRSFSVYPFNEYVVLNTGEIGKVVDINNENALRPTIQIIYSADGERIEESKIINLSRNASLFITRAIAASKLPK